MHIKGPQKRGKEIEEFLCASHLGTHKELFLKIMECHCRQQVSYEIKIAKTPGENWKARGGFGDEFECPAGTGAKLAPTTLS